MKTIHVRDIMTTTVVSVRPDTPLSEVARILFADHYNGVPVTDTKGTLMGLITEYDLMAKGSSVYFSSLEKTLTELRTLCADEQKLNEKIKELFSSEAHYVMNTMPLTLFPDNTIAEAADLFLRHHRVNPVPVIDDKGMLIGIISRHDFIKVYADSAFWKNLFDNEKDV